MRRNYTVMIWAFALWMAQVVDGGPRTYVDFSCEDGLYAHGQTVMCVDDDGYAGIRMCLRRQMTFCTSLASRE